MKLFQNRNKMKDSVIAPISGIAGAGGIEIIHQNASPSTTTLIMQLVVGVVSLIPSFKALFQKKRKL